MVKICGHIKNTQFYNYVYYGDGDTVIYQSPDQSEKIKGKFQRCPFNVGKPFFRWGYVILSQNKSDLVVF